MKKRPIIVTTHAIEAFARRLRDERDHFEIAAEIRECVAMALESGHVYDHRPKGFVLYGRKNNAMPPGQRFVQCDQDSNIGFIIKRTRDEGDIVVTTLTKAGIA